MSCYVINKDKLVQCVGDYYYDYNLPPRLRIRPRLLLRPQLIIEDLGIILEYLTPEQTWHEDYLKEYKYNKKWYKEGTYKVHFQKLKQTVYVFEDEIEQYIKKIKYKETLTQSKE